MDGREGRIPALVVTGPTATGKSQVAAELARLCGGEVICSDSMQVYHGLEIGTAAPGPAEKAGNVHHLYAIIEPDETYSVARYTQDALRVAREIDAKGKLPVFCGGTGQYIDAVARGIQFLPHTGDAALRAQLGDWYDREGPRPLLAVIAETDSAYADKLQPNDKKRVVRALELLRLTGYTVPEQNRRSMSGEPELDAFLAVLYYEDRAVLYRRIEQRVDAMMADGLLDEARWVYRNRERFKTAAQAIGYKELFPYFEAAVPLEECVGKLKQATRNYAKRQLTWFRREPEAAWYAMDHADSQDIAQRILADYKRKRDGGR